MAALSATYSASEVDKATTAYFLLNQVIGPPAIKKIIPLIECRSSRSLAQSASEYPINDRDSDFWYFRARDVVPAVKWASVGLDLNLDTAPTA